MICTIDIGNTSAKVALFTAEGKSIHFTRLSSSWQETFAELSAQYCRLTHVYISNVAGPQPELEQALTHLNAEVRWLTWETPEAAHYVHNIPAGLGADRLAAIIGARAACPDTDLVIVDAGTCLTFDVVRRDGFDLGGNISPGVALRLRSMHEHTAALPLFAPEGSAPECGYDLPTAMRGGAVNGVKWEIEGFVRAMQKQMPDLRVFTTGGNEFHFADDIARITTIDPLLVPRGLWEVFK